MVQHIRAYELIPQALPKDTQKPGKLEPAGLSLAMDKI